MLTCAKTVVLFTCTSRTVIVLCAVFLFISILFLIQQPRHNNFQRLSKCENSLIVRRAVVPKEASALRCQIIHIATVCVGYAQVTQLRTMLKSVFLHRSMPMEIHVLTDRSTYTALRIMLSTWRVQAFNWSLYMGDSHLEDVSWVQTKHYGGQYPFLKLLLPSILNHIQNVIVLDTDLIFLKDIAMLWEIFSTFEGDEVIAVAENLSDWYVKGKLRRNPWPSPPPRGINTGVMLLHLERLRMRNWYNMWADTTRAVMSNHDLDLDSPPLADQDIINAVLGAHPRWMLLLSCEWNFQLSDNSLVHKLCFRDSPAILHWNSQLKYDAVFEPSQDNVHPDYLTFLHVSKHIQIMDGAHVTSARLDTSCTNSVLSNHRHENRLQYVRPVESILAAYDDSKLMNMPPNVVTTCPPTYLNALKRRFQIHPYFLTYNHQAERQSEITLVTQFTIDRLSSFLKMANAWRGPISAVAYISEYDAYTQFRRLSIPNVALHVVYVPPIPFDGLYPINYLRNIAIELSQTPWYFHIDVDFAILPRLYDQLSTHVRSIGLGELAVESRIGPVRSIALVVPAFESVSYIQPLPKTKSELIWKLGIGEIQPFRAHEWLQGHRATNFRKWAATDTPYAIQHELGFEPYLVLPKVSPRFDELFLGFGWNKVSHVEELAVSGYNFYVLPDTYIVHSPHAPSLDLHAFRSHEIYRSCLTEVLKASRERMSRTHDSNHQQQQQYHFL